VIHYHQIDLALLVVAGAVVEVTVEVAATARQDPQQGEIEALSVKIGDHGVLATGALSQGEVHLPPRGGSATLHLIMAVPRRDIPHLPKTADWLLIKMGLITVTALGGRVEEVLLALKERVLLGVIEVLLKLMVAAAVLALEMIGALLMKMMTTAGLHEAARHREVFGGGA